MGSKFLGTNSNNLEVLQDGSFVLNVASADIQSLVPNMPVRASATRELVSGLIGVSDCNFTPLTNPVSSDLNMDNNSVTNAQQIGLPQNSSPSTPSAGSLNVYNDGGNLKIIDSSSTIQTVATTAAFASYLPLAGGTMSGSISLAANNLTNIGLISGAANSRTADNIVSNSGSSTSGNLASFSGSSGKIVTDSGIVASNVVTSAGSSTMGNVPAFFDASGKVISNSLVAVSNIVTNTGGAVTTGHVVVFGNSGGREIGTSLIPYNNLVLNSGGTVTSGQIATFSGTTGRLLTNSTTPILGTPASGTLTNCTGLPISTGVSGLATNVATMLGSFTSATVFNALPVTNGTGYLVFDTNPNFTGATQRLQPLKLSTLTQYEAFTASSTSTPTSYITANSVGTRFYAANTTNTGMVIKIRSFAQLNSWSGGGTLTISFYLNGAANIVLNVPAGTAAGSYLNADFDCTIRGTNLCRTQGVLLAAGQYPVLMDGGGTWTKTSSNNVDVLFTFSIASGGNIISPLSLTIETHYQK